MSLDRLDRFQEIVLVDTEYGTPPGERVIPVCVVAHLLRAGKTIRVWMDELRGMRASPYPIGRDALFVAYSCPAEFSFHIAVDWPLPLHVLDLYAEFRVIENGRKNPYGTSLIEAQNFFGIDISDPEKDSMRELAQEIARSRTWTHEQRRCLLDYCQRDVIGLQRLLPFVAEKIDLECALLRGRFTKAVAAIEDRGIPIDVPMFQELLQRWDDVIDHLIGEVDQGYGVYDGREFRRERFAAWLFKRGIPWPRLGDGKTLDLKKDTFSAMAQIFPEIADLHELRKTVAGMRLLDFPLGKDGRLRCSARPFAARTGRNQPSPSKFIFGTAKWLRLFIQTKPGSALAYIDWSGQEVGIAAALAGDRAMMEAYESGDPYLALAIQSGKAPPDATKKSHGLIRDQFKAAVLGVNYGMSEKGLAARLNISVAQARELLQAYRDAYPVFWKWSQAAVNRAMAFHSLEAIFGWTIHTQTPMSRNPRFLMNFPMQANGSEMLRLAVIFASDRGIKICAMVHDALLIEAPIDEIDRATASAQEAMSDASALVLNGYRLRTDPKIIRHPDHFDDEKGRKMWSLAWGVIRRIKEERDIAFAPSPAVTDFGMESNDHEVREHPGKNFPGRN